MKRFTFRSYLLLCMAAVAALPVLIFGIWQAGRWTDDELADADRQNLMIAHALARELEQSLVASTELVATLARQAETLPVLDHASLQPLIVAQKASLQGFLVLGVADAQATVLAADPAVDASGQSTIGLSYADRDYYQRIARTLAPAMSRPLRSRMTGNPAVAFGHPILSADRKTFRGYALGSFDLNQVRIVAERAAQVVPGVSAVVLDGEGRAIAHPDEQTYRELRNLSELPLYARGTAEGQLLEGTDETGEQVRAASVLIPRLGWTVMVSRPESLARAAARSTTRASVWIALGALVFSLLVAWRVATWLAAPITELASLTGKIGAGDFSVDAPPPRTGESREVAALMTSVQEMVGRLRGLVVSLRESKSRMSDAVHALTEVIRDQTRAVERQSMSVGDLTRHIRQIQQSSTDAAAKAGNVLAVTAVADSAHAEGQVSVDQTLDGLSEIHTQANAMRQMIEDLLRRTQQIEQVTFSAKDLADQSNMLALNAAIEATRAGEVGKGFSVVAREMRSLADRSIESTGRIRDILRQVEEAIRGAAQLSASGATKMEHGIEQVRSSGERLLQLTEVVANTSKAARDIASTVQVQDGEIAQITAVIDELLGAMTVTTEAIHRAESASAGLTETSESVSRTVDQLRV